MSAKTIKRIQRRIDARAKACVEAREHAKRLNPSIQWDRALKMPGSRNLDKRK